MRRIKFAFLLIALAGPALAADEPAACGGTDLFARLKDRDRAQYDRIAEEAHRIENSQGLLWRIEKPALAASYLFGTMHVTDRRVLANAARLDATLKNVKVLAVEISALGQTPEASASSMLARASDPGLKTLSRFREAVVRERLGEALRERGISDAAAEKFHPWFLAMLLSMPPCEMRRQAGQLPVLDRQIETSARAGGGNVVSLETMDEQLSAIASLPDDVVQAMIRQMAMLGPVRDDIFETLVQSYLDGNVARFMAGARKGGILGEADLSGMASFQQILIDRRNIAMRDRALPLLAKGEAMIAVGALHLPGPEGLIALFRKAGYRVTPVW